jgi:hypothetical protein
VFKKLFSNYGRSPGDISGLDLSDEVTADHIAGIAELDRKASLVNPDIIIAILESRCLQVRLTEFRQAHFADRSF